MLKKEDDVSPGGQGLPRSSTFARQGVGKQVWSCPLNIELADELKGVMKVWMLTQSVSKVPANLWAIHLALDLEDREFFSEAFGELRVGVG